MMHKVIFDVGSNDGTVFREAARQGHTVHSFEPTPKFANEIRSWVAEQGLTSYHFVEAAVSTSEGTMRFNISSGGDGGCSSLKEYTDNIHQIWYGRPDFNVTEIVNVAVIRMDTYVKTNNIERIDYLHIDTQGSDLDVLKSFGDELHRVVEGVVEVPNLISLYKGVPSKQETIDYLTEQGFQIVSIENDGGVGYEQNVYFRNRKFGEVSSTWIKSGTSGFRYT